MQVNNRNYIMNLFRLGFKIGRNTDNINNIANRIQNEENKQDFILGTGFGENQVMASTFGLSHLIRL